MSMEEIRRNYENLMEAVSLFKAIGIPIEVDITRMGFEEGALFTRGVIFLPESIKRDIEAFIITCLLLLRMKPKVYGTDLEKIAESIKREFDSFKEKTGYDMVDFVIYLLLYQAVAVMVAKRLGIDPADVDPDTTSKISMLILSAYKTDEEFRKEYELWRPGAEKLISVLKEKGLLG